MVFGISTDQDYVVYLLRRQELCTRLKEAYPDIKQGRILLFGAYEPTRGSFVQDSSVYYLTGLVEPGVMVAIDCDATAIVYRPSYTAEKNTWRSASLLDDERYCAQLRVSVLPLGKQVAGHSFNPYMSKDAFDQFIADMTAFIAEGGTFFVCTPSGQVGDVAQRVVYERCMQWISGFEKALVDVVPLIANMRRGKDAGEIELMTRAVDITVMAHEAALQSLAAGLYECEVQANIEFVFTASGAIPAFNTIVAGGKNAATLHYTENASELKNGDMVIIDCGAQQEHYCADISRTYPVSKKFTARQKEVYQVVLDAQEFIASKAVPGYWLRNDQEPEKSLTHLAREFFKKRGYEQFFKHGIGHFVGLDVHDAGDVLKPLQEGDVITLEPGLYLTEEGIGIRIEDMYWITKKGAVCLTDYLPKTIADIESVMEHIGAQELGFDEADEQDSCSQDCDDCDECDEDCDDCCHHS